MALEIKSDKGTFTLSGVVDAPMRAVWDIVSDTNRINQAVFDLAPVDVVDMTPEKITAVTKVGGFELAFEEQPWTWDAPRAYASVRIFTNGPLVRLESGCTLAERGPTSTEVSYRVVLQTKTGPIGFAAEKVFEARIKKGLGTLASILGSTTLPARIAHVNPSRAAVLERAAKFEADPAIVEHVASAPDDEVASIRPYVLAERWKRPRADVLDACLRAVGTGLLEMRWDTLCPSCKGALHSAAKLSETPEKATCPYCAVDFDVARDSHIEAVFAPVPRVRKAQPARFCLGNPSFTRHWLAQLVIEPGVTHPLSMTLGPGAYFVQSPGVPERTLIDVGENGETSVRVTLEKMRGGALPKATPVVKEGRVQVVLKNEDERSRRFQLVHDGFADLAATAAHVTITPSWAAISARAA